MRAFWLLLVSSACSTETVELFGPPSGGQAGTGGATGSWGGGASGPAGTGGEAGSRGGGASGPACPADMALVAGDEALHCIDALEVTHEDHAAAALAASHLPAAGCGWKQRFNASTATAPGLPAVGIDWCDAHAYCRSMGKRLCGRIGGSATSAARFDDAGRSQWHRACTNGGKTAYPYGATFEAGRCNDAGGDHLAAPPGAFAACHGEGPLAAAFDLSGNVHEWVDECDPEDPSGEAATKCLVRGGAFKDSDPNKLRCASKKPRPRSDVADDLGFRCCLDLAPAPGPG
jgi:formylglycine-generating enzyme required for sulfatase activity